MMRPLSVGRKSRRAADAPPQSVRPAPDLSGTGGPPSPQYCREPNVCIWNTQWGDTVRTARLKPGADKSGNKISPRRAEVFAPPIRANPQGIAHSPFRPLANSPLLRRVALGFNQSQISIDHNTDEFFKPDLRFPI